MNEETHPKLDDLPIGIGGTGMPRGTVSMGEIELPADRYWEAQTQRSLVHFSIRDDRLPKPVYHAYGYVKKAAALVNAAAGRLRNGRPTPLCVPPTRRSQVSSTITFRSMSGRPARRAPRRH